MEAIRAFGPEDVAAVADLYVRAYGLPHAQAPAPLRAYFEQIYFGSPWRSGELPSLVYEDSTGRVAGFVGLFERPLTWRGRPVRAAVLSAIMVDPSLRGRSIGLRLLRHAFAGTQDLIFTDGANDACRKLWQAAGGDVCFLLCCNWLRTLRPGAHLLDRARVRRGFGLLSRALRPAAAAFDALVPNASIGPYRIPPCDVRGEVADVSDLLACREQLVQQRALAPVYDAASFGWLLDVTAGATARGQLERIVVHDEQDRALGWYVYFANPRGLCEVMQLGGAAATIDRVLLHLFARARSRGGVLLRGRFEPAFATTLSDLHCDFAFPLTVLAHSRNPALLAAMHAGDCSLSRLDGEWWMRFADGPW